MYVEPDEEDRRTAKTVEDILADRWGQPVRVSEGEVLKSARFSKVYRMTLEDAPEAALSTVIAKRSCEPTDRGTQAGDELSSIQRFYNDWAGLEFVHTYLGSEELCPRFIGGDKEVGLVVMEDLGTDKRLDEILLGFDANAATDALMRMSLILATLHAVSRSHREQYDSIRAGIGEAPLAPVAAKRCASLCKRIQKCCDQLRVVLRPAVVDEIFALEEYFSDTGPFMAYIHNDACPDNFMMCGSKLKMWDFGWARFGQALIDGVYARLHFPSCWCVNRLPDGLVEDMESVYRNRLSQAIPEAKGTLYDRVMVEASAQLVVGTLGQGLHKEGNTHGISTLRQRFLLRFELFAQTTQRFDHMQATGALFREIATRSRELWAEEELDMPVYPAFRQ